MKINTILTFALLISLNAYCGKIKDPLIARNQRAFQRRGSELLEIFSTFKDIDNKEEFFHKIIIDFCSNYPNLEKTTTSDASKIYSDGILQEPIISILFLMRLQKKEKHLIEYFLKGKNLDCYLKHDISLLHIAARYNRIKVIQDLIEKGANINSLDKFGNTPLSVAIHCNNKEAQAILENNGALEEVRRKSKCESCVIL